VSPGEELRAAFDASFALAPAEPHVRPEDFLGIGMADRPFALRLGDVAGLFVDKHIAPLPGPAPALLGIAGFRGATVPVYDLRALLGFEVGKVPRWLVLVAGKDALALAFDRFEGHLRIASDAIAAEPSSGRGVFTREIIRIGGETRTVVDVGAVARTINEQAGPRGPASAER
jgi:chemotaxis signal transduction protein